MNVLALGFALLLSNSNAFAQLPMTQKDVIRLVVMENGAKMIENWDQPIAITEWWLVTITEQGENGEPYFSRLSEAKCTEAADEVVCRILFIQNSLESNDALQKAAERIGIDNWVFEETENCASGITVRFKSVGSELEFKSGAISEALCGD